MNGRSVRQCFIQGWTKTGAWVLVLMTFGTGPIPALCGGSAGKGVLAAAGAPRPGAGPPAGKGWFPMSRHFTLALFAATAGIALTSSALAGASAAGAAPTRPAGPAASFTISGGFSGVAVTSARSAWAVGAAGNGSGEKTLIAHWNGTAWKQVRSPSPVGGSFLDGVAATSARNAWAVGGTQPATGRGRP